MSNATPEFRGTVRGSIIELDGPLGLDDGQAVVVTVRPIAAKEQLLREAFGTWSDDPDGLDDFLKEMRESRHAPARESHP